MTARAPVLAAAGSPPFVRRWAGPTLLAAALAAVVGARWLATRAGLDALLVGAIFGLALAAVATDPLSGAAMSAIRRAVGASRLGISSRLGVSPGVARDLAIGTLAGLGLVTLALAGAALAGVPLVPGLGRAAAPFVPWVLVTIVVASAEEVLLRGRLFDAVRSSSGPATAVGVTTVAFALLHVPLYGWHVVPLDLGVGLVLAGLRLRTGRVVAPAAAHAVADLATWWL